MNIFILIGGILILLGLSYYINQRNLLAPSLVCCASFLVGTSLLANNALSDGFDIHPVTVGMILLGLSSVISGERMAIVGRHYTKSIRQENSFKTISYIKVNAKLSIILLAINIVAVYLFYREVVRIGTLAATLNITSFDDIMSAYRVSMMFGDTLDYNVNQKVSQLVKVPIVSAYIYLYIFIFNMIKGQKIKKNILNLMVAIPFFFYTFYSGGRIGFIKILAAILWYIFIIMYFKKNGREFHQFESKFKRNVLIALAVILGLFYSLRIAMGRANTEDAEFLDYITMYVGTPTRLLDMYLQEHHDDEFDITKSETFTGVSVLLAKMEGKKQNAGLEFRSSGNGTNLGNVYTPFRRYYHDFGWFGVILLPLLMGFILAKIQCKTYFCRVYGRRCTFYILLFAYLYTGLPIYAADDIFYLRINIGFVEELVLIYILYKLTIKYAIEQTRTQA